MSPLINIRFCVMNRDADTTIISEYFPGYIKAKAKTVDLNNKVVLLGDFKYINEKTRPT